VSVFVIGLNHRTVPLDLFERMALPSARSVSPLIAQLRGRADRVRIVEIERLTRRLSDLDARQRDAVEAMAAGIVGKLLHDPTVRLKNTAGTARGERLAEALRDPFDL
jgi:glutamyl-tRNA reductase